MTREYMRSSLGYTNSTKSSVHATLPALHECERLSINQLRLRKRFIAPDGQSLFPRPDFSMKSLNFSTEWRNSKLV
eukprot:20508_5